MEGQERMMSPALRPWRGHGLRAGRNHAGARAGTGGTDPKRENGRQSESMEAVVVYEFVLRWIHFLAGITWIGLLYYFNLVQGAFMGEAAGGTKTDVTTKLMPRALWWFRWGAMITVIAGILIIINRIAQGGWEVMGTAWGISISIGGVLGLIMWFNVWFIIWPNQKVIIATTQAAAAKGEAPQGLGNRPRVAFLASRTNTMLSIPMLFFMGAASHGPWGLF
jgi:uncharacterized membrane protein